MSRQCHITVVRTSGNKYRIVELGVEAENISQLVKLIYELWEEGYLFISTRYCGIYSPLNNEEATNLDSELYKIYSQNEREKLFFNLELSHLLIKET